MDVNLVFQTIGTIASISSIPIAVVIFQKTKKSNFDETKKDILKKISFIVADENEITSIEVLAIIKSTLRTNNIKENKILATEIIEDMISEVISNPLLIGKRKVDINNNLKKIMSEFMIVTSITAMNTDEQKEYLNKMKNDKNDMHSVENNEIIYKINNEKVLNVKLNQRNKIKDSITAITAILVSMLSALLAGYALLLDPQNIKDIISLNVNWFILFVSCFAVFSIIYVLIPKKKRT